MLTSIAGSLVIVRAILISGAFLQSTAILLLGAAEIPLAWLNCRLIKDVRALKRQFHRRIEAGTRLLEKPKVQTSKPPNPVRSTAVNRVQRKGAK